MVDRLFCSRLTSGRMNLLPLIEGKRDRKTIPPRQIQQMTEAAAHEACQPEQLGALLMAICLNGLDASETRGLTMAMRDSGEVLKFPDDPRPLVDKHSTGGVGDKVSLILAPLLAALEFRVPMISGRGLGITGGTLDKMESIPGLRTNLSPDEIIDQVQNVGCVICGQTQSMVPADRVLYAMRDITGTIESIPLITSSILSKKLAEGTSSLLLDVKFGRAAFMGTVADARQLAHSMTGLGRECGLNVRALLTEMDTPLGRAAGNWLEVREIVDCLNGKAPRDVEQLVVESAAHLLEMTGRASSLEAARTDVLHCMNTSQPKQRFEEMLVAQGADMKAFNEKLQKDSAAPVVSMLKAESSGYVENCDARIIGELIRELGGGRAARTDLVNPDVGVDQILKPGDAVDDDGVLARVHAPDDSTAIQALVKLKSAFKIQAAPPTPRPLIFESIR